MTTKSRKSGKPKAAAKAQRRLLRVESHDEALVLDVVGGCLRSVIEEIAPLLGLDGQAEDAVRAAIARLPAADVAEGTAEPEESNWSLGSITCFVARDPETGVACYDMHDTATGERYDGAETGASAEAIVAALLEDYSSGCGDDHQWEISFFAPVEVSSQSAEKRALAKGVQPRARKKHAPPVKAKASKKTAGKPAKGKTGVKLRKDMPTDRGHDD